MKNIPRINSIVRFDKGNMSDEIYNEYYKEVFNDKDFVFMGEIPNQEGHCMLIDLRDNNKIIGPYHTWDFFELKEYGS